MEGESNEPERFYDHVQSPSSDQELLFEKFDEDAQKQDSVAPLSPAHTGEVGLKAKFSRFIQKAKNLTDTEGPEIGKVALKREITPLSGVGFVVGQLIGSGIFITPSNILAYTGSFGLSIVCWIIGAVVALAGALCYLELGLLVRKAGGEYAILLEAYSFRKKNPWVEMLGSLVSFLFTWTTVFVLRGASASIITLTCARYLSRPFFIGCDVPENVVKLIALSVLLILVLVNCYSMKLTARVTVIFSGLKMFAVIFIVAVGIITAAVRQGFPDDLHQPFQPLEGHEPTASSVALALYSVMWAFDGWSIMNYAIEEMKNVERTMPISLFVGIPLVTLCYVMVNVAFFIVLSYDKILSAKAVALPFGDATLGKAGLVIIPIFVAFSTFGAANGSVYTSSRLIFGAARDRLLPDSLSGLHTKYKTPVPALILLAIMATIMISVGDIGELIEAFSAAAFVFYMLVFIAVLIMRVTHHEQPRLFKAYFIVPVALFATLSSLFLLILPILQKPQPTLLALGATLIGIPFYIFLVMETPWKLRPAFLDKISRRISWHVNNLLSTQSSREQINVV